MVSERRERAMWAWLRSLLMVAFRWARATLYPPPERPPVLVTRGANTKETVVARAVIFAAEHCGARSMRVVHEVREESAGEEECEEGTREEQDDNDACGIVLDGQRCVGMHATCRYVGAHAGLCSSDPEACMVVDSALSALGEAMSASVTKGEKRSPTKAKRGVLAMWDGASPSLLGFDSPTVADYAWMAFMDWNWNRRGRSLDEDEEATEDGDHVDKAEDAKEDDGDRGAQVEEREGENGEATYGEAEADEDRETEWDEEEESKERDDSEARSYDVYDWYVCMRDSIEYAECVRRAWAEEEETEDNEVGARQDEEGDAKDDGCKPHED